MTDEIKNEDEEVKEDDSSPQGETNGEEASSEADPGSTSGADTEGGSEVPPVPEPASEGE